jgi:general secretion pathway protein H
MRDQRGFTLLELVVVLVIVGIITGFALLSLGTGSSRDRVEDEGRRLAAMLAHQRELAMLRLDNRGLVLTETGYGLLQLERDGWAAVPDRGKDLPEGLRLELRVDDLPATLKSRQELEKKRAEANAEANTEAEAAGDQDTTSKQEPPQLWIFSTGEFLPFELSVVDAAEEHRFTIAGNAAGQLEITFESNVQ